MKLRRIVVAVSVILATFSIAGAPAAQAAPISRSTPAVSTQDFCGGGIGWIFCRMFG